MAISELYSDVPTLLKEQIGIKVPRFEGPIQQDAQDFLLTLLNLLYEVTIIVSPFFT